MDLHSTSTRAVLSPRAPDSRGIQTVKRAVYVCNPRYTTTQSSRYERGEFSTVGYPFDGKQVYLEEDHEGRKCNEILKGYTGLGSNTIDYVHETIESCILQHEARTSVLG